MYILNSVFSKFIKIFSLKDILMFLTKELLQQAHEAAKDGHLQWFKNSLSAGTIIKDVTESSDLIKVAIEYKQLEILKWFFTVSPLTSKVPLDFDPETVDCFVSLATKVGSLDIAKLLIHDAGFQLESFANPVITAIEYGQLELLQYLLEDLNAIVDLNDEAPILLAIANGHLDIVKYLVAEYSSQCIDLFVDEYEVIRIAAAYGRLDILKWLIEDSGHTVDVTAHENAAVRKAVEYNHLDVLRYFIEDCSQLVDISAVDAETIIRAEENESESAIRYVFDVIELRKTASLSQFRLITKMASPRVANTMVLEIGIEAYIEYLQRTNRTLITKLM